MRKLLNNPWLVGAIAVIALGFVIHSILPSKPHYSQVASETADGTPTEGNGDVADASTISIPNALKALAISSPLRDPFALTASVEKTAAVEKEAPPADSVDSVHLSAVWIQKDSNLALVNGRIVGPGEEFGRLKIESATSEGIWITHWKGRNFVSVGGDFSLSTPATQPSTSTSSL